MTTRGRLVPVGAHMRVRLKPGRTHRSALQEINYLLERNSVSPGFACLGLEFNIPQKGIVSLCLSV